MIDVYCHTSPVGKRYIGVTVRSMRARWQHHVRDALRGSGYLFHRAIRKYGPEAFTHELLSVCDTDAGARAAERYWIRVRETRAPIGYNLTDGGDGVPGFKLSEAECARRSAVMRGNKLGERNRGQKRTPEQCERIGAVQRGRALSPVHRANIGAAQLGRKRTPEARRNISDGLVGNTNARGRTLSDQHKVRISAAQKARHAARKNCSK